MIQNSQVSMLSSLITQFVFSFFSLKPKFNCAYYNIDQPHIFFTDSLIATSLSKLVALSIPILSKPSKQSQKLKKIVFC